MSKAKKGKNTEFTVEFMLTGNIYQAGHLH